MTEAVAFVVGTTLFMGVITRGRFVAARRRTSVDVADKLPRAHRIRCCSDSSRWRVRDS